MSKLKITSKYILIVALLFSIELSANFNACTTSECLRGTVETIEDYYKRDFHFLYGYPTLESLDMLAESQEIINVREIVDHICTKTVKKNVKYIAQLATNMQCFFLQGDYPELISQYLKHKSKLSEQKAYNNDDFVIKILYARVLWKLGDRELANEVEKEFVSDFHIKKRKMDILERISYYFLTTNQKEKLILFILNQITPTSYSEKRIWSCKSDFDLFINNILFQERYPSGWNDEIVKKYSELYAENKESRCKPLPKRFPRPGDK